MLVECLVREGVDCLFGYPGESRFRFMNVLLRPPLRHVLVRHEENAAFAAEGYARATGKVGVLLRHLGPRRHEPDDRAGGRHDGFHPHRGFTGQVTSKLIGSDAFQEADTFGITRPCTKHNYLVKKLEDLAQIIHEAFYVAASGRPGPVLVDITKDVLQAQGHYQPVTAVHLPGYRVFTEGHTGQVRRAAQLVQEAQRPLVYGGAA